MPVFGAVLFGPALERMGMVVVLGVGFVIVDVSRRIVVPLLEFVVAFEHFADHVGVGFSEQPIAFQNLIASLGHFFQLGDA